MARDDIGSNRSTDDDQRIRAIATGVVTAAINDIHPLLDGVPLLQAQLEEVLQRLEALSPNGNRVDDQRRGGADEITRGPTSLTRNPENIPQYQHTQSLPMISSPNSQLIESEERALRRTQGDRDYKLNVEMPIFKGTQNVDEFFSWIDEVETGFGVMDCSEDRKLKVVANKLKGSTAAYWKYLKNKRVLDGKPPIATWEKMKSKFMGDCEEEGDDGHETEVVDEIEEVEEDDFVGMVMSQPCESQTKILVKIAQHRSVEILEAEEGGNEKINCIVQRVFLTPKKGLEISTRHQVFRTNALVNGVTTNVVIDTGSSENLVSKKLVRKLKLSIEKHPQPYGLRWIRKVEGATDVVNEVCRVPLSIGKNYKAEVV
ncbi:hypothetical protein LWI29_028173 [Acer saccharum]|uniref:Retrotransposon gag domain-containing protein n=1 Tax=Acer saccharum TaxID=4024 RepID=A0AA39VVV4_ACESA|nr:hypothetical protein LWI29_028173 [Acer saccharum]